MPGSRKREMVSQMLSEKFLYKKHATPSPSPGESHSTKSSTYKRPINEIAVHAENLSKCYYIYRRPYDRLKQSLYPRLQNFIGKPVKKYHREFWALKDVSFDVRCGETFGIIGLNGSGKSTVLQIIAGTLLATGGKVEAHGRIAALLELGSGFNPEFTGRENVILNGRILGLTTKEIEDRYEKIVDFAEIGEFMNQPVKTYSSGMYLRLAFSVQAHIDASIVIIDEALAVGDVFFRQKCYARLEQLRKVGAAILFVSHSMPDIEQYCDRAILLDSGVQRFIGPATEATKHYYLANQKEKYKTQIQVHASEDNQIQFLGRNAVNPPTVEAFFDLSGKAQIKNGQAVCTGVALCNDLGQPCNSFQQGNTAYFYYEFEVNDNLSVPICGIVISNDKGIIVYGKNSWQFNEEVPKNVRPGTKLLCHHEVKLDLAFGDYVFEVGLASVANDVWSKERIFLFTNFHHL